MDLWKSDLEVSEDYILENTVVKVFDQETFIGFFGIKAMEGGNLEIDHLWLIPDKIKKGYGRAVFQYILNDLRANGHKKATLTAEPNAKGFYDKMGGKIVGQFQSKINGRFLDIYEFSC
jgi:N-acetylglutamate synthase-like GNAT family acetyltransferase